MIITLVAPSSRANPGTGIRSRLGPKHITERLGKRITERLGKPLNSGWDQARRNDRPIRGGRKFGKPREQKKPLSNEDLDAEMDAYMNADKGEAKPREIVSYEDVTVVNAEL